MSKQRFRVGDIVQWDLPFATQHYKCDRIPGPFFVIRKFLYAACSTGWIVSVKQMSDGKIPTHSGTEVHNGNHWDMQFFKLDPYLTAVYARKRVRGLAQRQADLDTQLPKLPKKRR